MKESLLLLTYLLANSATAQLVPAPQKDADKWLFAEQTRLEWIGSTWGAHGEFVRGTMCVPVYTDLLCSRTLEIPQRLCVQGPDLHVREMPGFRPAEGFVPGQWLVVYDRGVNQNNWNGNFSTVWRDVCVTGETPGKKRVANGLRFGGAQGSSITNCSFVNMFDNRETPEVQSVALELLPTRGQIVLTNIEMSNHDRLDAERVRIYGTGLKINKVTGVSGRGINSHSHAIGIDVYGSHEVVLDGVSLEKTRTITVRDGSTGVKIRGIDFQAPQHDVLFDLSGSGSGNYFEGKVRRAPAKTYVIGPRGKKWPFVNGAQSAGGKRFAMWTEESLDEKGKYQVEVKVKVNPYGRP